MPLTIDTLCRLQMEPNAHLGTAQDASTDAMDWVKSLKSKILFGNCEDFHRHKGKMFNCSPLLNL